MNLKFAKPPSEKEYRLTDDTITNDNVTEIVAPKTPFKVITGGLEFEAPRQTEAQAENEIPQNDYIVVDFDDNQHFATGFLLFTSQHVAVMQGQEAGNAIPALVLPLSHVKFASLYNPADDVQVELPL